MSDIRPMQVARVAVSDEGIERIPPDPDAVFIAKAIIEQNDRILEINARLITWTSSPMLYIKRSDADTKG